MDIDAVTIKKGIGKPISNCPKYWLSKVSKIGWLGNWSRITTIAAANPLNDAIIPSGNRIKSLKSLSFPILKNTHLKSLNFPFNHFLPIILKCTLINQILENPL